MLRTITCRHWHPEAKWRIPLGDSGVLNFFLEIFSGHVLRHTLKIHVLRLIGNSCADTGKQFRSRLRREDWLWGDENRARIVASNAMSSLILQLQDVTLIAFAIPVLYNICIDYGKFFKTCPWDMADSDRTCTKASLRVFSDERAYHFDFQPEIQRKSSFSWIRLQAVRLDGSTRYAWLDIDRSRLKTADEN